MYLDLAHLDIIYTFTIQIIKYNYLEVNLVMVTLKIKFKHQDIYRLQVNY